MGKISVEPMIWFLGETEYRVMPSAKRNRTWRKTFHARAQPFLDLLDTSINVDIANVGQLVDVIKGASDKLIYAVDDVADLIFLYAPELDREAIEEVATDEQLMDAFYTLLGRAFPANFIQRLVSRSGVSLSGTSMSLPSRNGASAPEPSRNLS